MQRINRQNAEKLANKTANIKQIVRNFSETQLQRRRRRHRLGIERAVQSPEFLSELAEGLAGVNLFESDPGATKQLVAAALRLDVLAAEGAQQPGGAPKRRRRGVA